ncbi:hypothetical protein AAMO2058_000375500 [Amorphochlora amoebiformis]
MATEEVADALLGTLANKISERAVKRAKDEAHKLGRSAGKLSKGLSCMAFVGGLLTAMLSFLGIFNVLDPLQILVEVYTFFFGILISILEMQHQCIPLAFFRTWARFLTTTGGRGLFYMYVGSLILAKWTLLSLGVGGYMFAVGCMYVFTSCSNRDSRGEELRKFEGESKQKGAAEVKENIKAVWANLDPENDGAIYTIQLGKLCKELGNPLSKEDLREAKKQLDPDKVGEIEFTDFLSWWVSVVDLEP